MLKCEKKVVYEVDYSDLERFIDKEFGVGFDDKYELPALEEKCNDVHMKFLCIWVSLKSMSSCISLLV